MRRLGVKPFVTGELTITRPGGEVEVVRMEEWRRRHPMDGSWSKGREGVLIAPRRYGYGPRAHGIDGRFGRGGKRRSPPEGEAA